MTRRDLPSCSLNVVNIGVRMHCTFLASNLGSSAGNFVEHSNKLMIVMNNSYLPDNLLSVRSTKVMRQRNKYHVLKLCCDLNIKM